MTSWRQFSLRTFLLAVMLLSIALAWIRHERVQTARENAAAAYLVEREVTLMEGGPPVRRRTGWMLMLLGDNRAAQYRDVHLNKTRIVDDDLARLQDLPNLEDFFLGENVSDHGFARLRGHPNATLLFIDGSNITDDGLAVVRTLPRLRKLVLWRTPITGAGFVHLRGLKLETVDICQSPIHDEHLQFLQQLSHIKTLDLGETPITDAGLVHLQQIKTLRKVNLTLCPVTENGVDELLASNPELIILDRFRPRGTRVITY